MNMHRTGRLLCLLLAALLLTCPGCAKKQTVISDAAYFSDYLTGYDLNRPIRFEIVFADGHVAEGQMDYYNAPITCGNFIKLCKEGYYDGLTIHRVVADTLIQGGDRNGDGTYRMDYAIRGEFKDNGWNNRMQHVRGTVSMARWSDDLNSADAQFFIMLSTHYAYDSKSAGFATITSGMAYIEELANAEVVEGTDRPVHPAVIETIRILGN